MRFTCPTGPDVNQSDRVNPGRMTTRFARADPDPRHTQRERIACAYESKHDESHKRPHNSFFLRTHTQTYNMSAGTRVSVYYLVYGELVFETKRHGCRARTPPSYRTGGFHVGREQRVVAVTNCQLLRTSDHRDHHLNRKREEQVTTNVAVESLRWQPSCPPTAETMARPCN